MFQGFELKFDGNSFTVCLGTEYEKDLGLVRKIIHEGNDKARDMARQTLAEVRQAMGLEYR